MVTQKQEKSKTQVTFHQTSAQTIQSTDSNQVNNQVDNGETSNDVKSEYVQAQATSETSSTYNLDDCFCFIMSSEKCVDYKVYFPV